MTSKFQLWIKKQAFIEKSFENMVGTETSSWVTDGVNNWHNKMFHTKSQEQSQC